MVRTTIVLDDPLFNKIKALSFQKHKTLKETVTELLRRGLSRDRPEQKVKIKLHTFNSGGSTVPIHDRNALYDRMDGRI